MSVIAANIKLSKKTIDPAATITNLVRYSLCCGKRNIRKKKLERHLSDKFLDECHLEKADCHPIKV